MWKIRFFQYPRNSVENLNRALYVKLLKTQWLSDRKLLPFPAWGREVEFPEITRNETITKNKTFIIFRIFFTFLSIAYHCLCVFSVIYFSNMNTRRHPEPRIPPDSRSVQILYRISGMLNERSFTHRWWYVSCFTTLAQMGIVSATLFLQSWLDIAQNPSSILSSPFGKMRDLQYSLNLCVFHEFVKTRKNTKNDVFHTFAK